MATGEHLECGVLAQSHVEVVDKQEGVPVTTLHLRMEDESVQDVLRKQYLVVQNVALVCNSMKTKYCTS